MIIRLTVAILAVFMLPCMAAAEVVKPNDDFWYLDEANVLSDATEGEIFFANKRLYEACGAEIVVAVINSTGRLSIDDYAYTLFNEWQIGGDTYRGLLLLMSVKDDDYYVMPGTAMGEHFDSATIASLMEKHLEPAFAAKNYDEGARLFFEAAYEKMADVLNLNLSISDAKADYEAFLRESENTSTNASVSIDPIVRSEDLGKRRQNTVSALPVILIMFLALFIILRSSPRRTYAHRRSNHSSMLTGFILGRMSAGRHSRGSSSFFGVPPMGSRPPFRRTSSTNHAPRSGSFSSGRSTGFGGAGRSSFGGASRNSFGSSSRSGGFGGASRSGGNSRGPSTRGGGAGRFSRK